MALSLGPLRGDMQRRRYTRHKRYFPVRFGDGEAQTRDVSAGGLCVATREVQPLGTRLWIELIVGDWVQSATPVTPLSVWPDGAEADKSASAKHPQSADHRFSSD